MFASLRSGILFTVGEDIQLVLAFSRAHAGGLSQPIKYELDITCLCEKVYESQG
jgi:hypothetical protein